MEDTVRRRIASSIVVAVAVLIGTAGCNLVAPQATTKHYFASDGVSVDVNDDIAVRNAVVITDEGKLGNLVMTVVNTSTDDARLTVQHETSDGDKKNVTVSVPAASTTVFGYPDGETVLLRSLGAEPGSLLPIYVHSGSETGKQILVPVLDGGLPEYEELLPVDVVRSK
jgi:hypothetical protein